MLSNAYREGVRGYYRSFMQWLHFSQPSISRFIVRVLWIAIGSFGSKFESFLPYLEIR